MKWAGRMLVGGVMAVTAGSMFALGAVLALTQGWF